MLRHFINLNEGKVEDPRRAKPITPRDPDFQLTQEQKTALFYQLQLTMHQQADKREKGRREAAPITGIFARARRQA